MGHVALVEAMVAHVFEYTQARRSAGDYVCFYTGSVQRHGGDEYHIYGPKTAVDAIKGN